MGVQGAKPIAGCSGVSPRKFPLIITLGEQKL